MGSECSILMIPFISINTVKPIFQESLLSSLKHTFPPANTCKCLKPSMQTTYGGSWGNFSPMIALNL